MNFFEILFKIMEILHQILFAKELEEKEKELGIIRPRFSWRKNWKLVVISLLLWLTCFLPIVFFDIWGWVIDFGMALIVFIGIIIYFKPVREYISRLRPIRKK